MLDRVPHAGSDRLPTPCAAVSSIVCGEYTLDTLDGVGEVGEPGPIAMWLVTWGVIGNAMTGGVSGARRATGLKGCCRVSGPTRRHDTGSTRATTPTCSSCAI